MTDALPTAGEADGTLSASGRKGRPRHASPNEQATADKRTKRSDRAAQGAHAATGARAAAEERAAAGAHAPQSGRATANGRTSQGERATAAGRASQGERVAVGTHTPQSERAAATRSTSRSERTAATGRASRGERAARSARAAAGAHSAAGAHASQSEHATATGRAAQGERATAAGRASRGARTEAAKHASQGERPAAAERASQGERTEADARAAQEKRTPEGTHAKAGEQNAQAKHATPSPVEKRAAHTREIVQAAESARKRAQEGFTTQDYRRELRRSRGSKRLKVTLGIVGGVLAFIALALGIVFTVILPLHPISDNTMAPALANGQSVAVQRTSDVANGDVALCQFDAGEPSFKRVVAQQNQWVNILGDGTLLVSDEMLDNAQIHERSGSSAPVSISRQVPAGHIYAISDSQADSPSIAGLANGTDFVAADHVLGKAVFRAWPPSALGPIG